MRISALAIANGLAWAAFGLIFAAAVVMADVLGFLGLFIIGAITWMVCVRAGQDDNPDWQTSARRAAAAEQPEQRAARLSSWQAALHPIRFFARCGMALTAVGAAGFLWQYWAGVAANGH